MSGFSLTLKAEKVDVLCVGPSVFLSFELSLTRSLSRFIINLNVNGKGFFYSRTKAYISWIVFRSILPAFLIYQSLP